MDIDINAAFIVNVTLISGIILVALMFAAYAMAKSGFCFTFIKEGTAKAIMRGGTFSHFIMAWAGHSLNDPRRMSYDRAHPAWEVLYWADRPNAHPSPYAWWQLHWRFFALFGIYWFGLSPLYRIYRYEFEWTEQKFGEDGQPCPWHRSEWTDFIFVKAFPYWTELKGAEDAENLQLDLDYLNRVEINNPYKALFGIEDWLDQGTADSNNRAKVYTGDHSFNQIKKEKEHEESGMSGLTRYVTSINDNLLTSPDHNKGAPDLYGMTVVGCSLVSVSTAGKVKEEAEKALAAEELEKLRAKAVVAAAEGYAEAERVKAHGDADATVTRATGEADAIKKRYDSITSYGEEGVRLYEMDTLTKTASSPNNTTFVWANNFLRDFFGGRAPANGNTPKP